jgi:hypothetical protein
LLLLTLGAEKFGASPASISEVRRDFLRSRFGQLQTCKAREVDESELP